MKIQIIAVAAVLAAAPAYAGGSSSVSGTTSSTSGAVSGSTASNAGNAQTITSNSYVPSKEVIYNTPSPVAPALAATLTGVCVGSGSVGVGWAGFGLSGGKSAENVQCDLRQNAEVLANVIGDKDAARQVMCESDDVRKAYAKLHRPCL